MLDLKGRKIGSTAQNRRIARKATRHAAKMLLKKGIEPAPRYPRDKQYLD